MTPMLDIDRKANENSLQMQMNMSQENETCIQGNSTAISGSSGAMESQSADTIEYKDEWGNSVKPFNSTSPYRGRGAHFNRVMTRGGGGKTEQNWQKSSTSTSPGSTPQLELWVETKTDDGKAYYYHAITRDTTWNRPEGPNVKIMTQTDVEDINKKQQQIQQQQNQANIAPSQNIASAIDEATTKDKIDTTKVTTDITSQPPPEIHSQPPLAQQSLSQPPPNLVTATVASLSTQQPPPTIHQAPPYFPPGMQPPTFGQSPYGMPPPGYGGGFIGASTAATAPWGMPWNQHVHPAAIQEKPAKNLIIKPGVIDPAVIARAAEWSEHRAPDGRPYYYHTGRGISVWDKPQALRDMEAARMAAHGATPLPGATAAPTMIPGIPPHLMPHLMPTPAASPQFTDPTLAYAQAAVVAAVTSNVKQPESTKSVVALQEKEANKKSEEKGKKEEEQKRSLAPAKPVDKTRPISSTPISGTPWCVVWTGDARVFFYNPSTRTSVWERPEDLLDREDVDKAVRNPPEQLKNAVETKIDKAERIITNEKEVSSTVPTTVSTNVESDEELQADDDDVIKIRSESESSVEEVLEKKPRIMTKSSKKANASEAAIEAEVRAAKERAVVPLEARVKQFKEMLREKDVSAFSTWEKELHKIVFDPRYLLLTSKERKQVFEKYVKDRAEEERKEKRNKMRQKREDFRKLLEDAKLNGKSSFSEFCQRYGKDERYKCIEKVREREGLFNEFLLEVRRREKEERQLKKDQIRKDFLEMLRERACSMDRHTRWYDVKKKFESDSRYRAVENSAYREEYFQDFMREEKRKHEREKEREREREKERDKERKRKSERKDKERKRVRSRSRDRIRLEKDCKDFKDKERIKEKDKDEEKKKHDDYEEGEHSSVGEIEDYNSGDEYEAEDEEIERLKKERERQIRAEQSIREREKEVQRTLAGHLRDRDKERELHKREEAIGHFKALLADLVRNPDLTWKEVKRQLRKDHRWELVEVLDRDVREKIFIEHIENLMKKKREKFREMLDELPVLGLTSTWKDIKKLIKEDPRYLKYNNSDKCEREFRDYMVDTTISAKIDLKELLKECKLITHKSSDLVKENPHHLKEIQDILKMDKRYLVLEHLSEERTKIVLDYLEELHKRGPPPPPTASDVTRRK